MNDIKQYFVESVSLQRYIDIVRDTDRLPKDDLRPVLMGLFGEVGSIMAPAKKLHREGVAYIGYQSAVEEEFGDALWYLAALSSRLNVNLSDIFSQAVQGDDIVTTVAASDVIDAPLVHFSSFKVLDELDSTLIELGKAASALLVLDDDKDNISKLLGEFVKKYLGAMQTAKISFSQVVSGNLKKTQGRFLKADASLLPVFDSEFENDERLPNNFEITVIQRKNGRCYLQWNGVFIGDPLTDNITDSDGFRFHDVFHFAHAAVLHWSPTFRALIKHKRKSNPYIDETQDGGRAIVVEEGLTAWLFSRAKELNFFENQDGVSFDLLKTIQQFVKGYEVEACPLNLWESAILQGYEVFRQIRLHNGGVVIGNRNNRSLSFRLLADAE